MITLNRDELFLLPDCELIDLYGKKIRLKGALVISRGECFFIPDVDSLGLNKRVDIYCPGLERRLDLSVGGWVGGPASYLDVVEIIGVIHEGTTRGEFASLSNIDGLILEREGERFVVY